MLQILQSETKVFIGSGFIYLPLLFDPSIEEEIRAYGLDSSGYLNNGQSPRLIKVRGEYFVKSLAISPLLNTYEKVDPETYEYLRSMVFSKFLRSLSPGSISMDEELLAIVFQVMPHFIRKKNRLRRKRITGEEILDLIWRKVSIPPRFHDEAAKLSDTASIQKKLRTFSGPRPADEPSLSGLVPAQSFRQWFLRALESRILEHEKTRLADLLYNRERFSRLQRRYIAILLFVKEIGAFEISGCGFFRNGNSSEYYVYVRTGRYALKDFYRRLYLFPDCRVAVSTYGPVVPYVIDRYKHPFLKGHDKMQKICVRGDFIPAERFNASAAIQALEEGVSALFHGYNSRRGNGYNRLDAMKFEKNSIVFEEYRIPLDDPRVVSGEVEVKNDFY